MNAEQAEDEPDAAFLGDDFWMKSTNAISSIRQTHLPEIYASLDQLVFNRHRCDFEAEWKLYEERKAALMRTLQDLEENIKTFHEEFEETDAGGIPMKKAMLGLQILLKYDPEGSTCAEHDVLYAGGCSPEDMQAYDVAKLSQLNWRWSPEENSWVFFT